MSESELEKPDGPILQDLECLRKGSRLYCPVNEEPLKFSEAGDMVDHSFHKHFLDLVISQASCLV